MASMTVLSSTTELSDYASRSVTVEVVGGYRQMRRTAMYRMTVPYSRLSQTIQQIHRHGGKINQVTLSSTEENSNRKAESELFSNPELPAEPPSVVAAESVSPSPKPRRSKSPANPQSSAKSTKSTTKSTKNTQGQRSKRKTK
jgi:hypothetical protein